MVRLGVIVGTYPEAEQRRREDIVRSYATSEAAIEIFHVDASPYQQDLTGGDVLVLGPTFVDAAKRAERSGVDAVVPFGTLDIGVEAARSYLTVPIIGPLEAGLRLATFLGDRIGLITYTTHATPYQSSLARHYGLEERIVGSRAIDISLNHIVNEEKQLRSLFLAAADELITAGAEVVIPAGVTLCPVWMTASSLMDELGVPVVECVGAPIRVAAMLAQAGLSHSRKRYPSSVL